MRTRKPWSKEARERHLKACREYAKRQKIIKLIFHIIKNGSPVQKRRLFKTMKSVVLKAEEAEVNA